jgi:hypothetical protein
MRGSVIALSLYHASVSFPPGGTVTMNLQDDAYTSATDVMFTYANTSDASILVRHSPVLTNGFLGPYSATADTTTDNSATITEATVPATVPATMEVVDQVTGGYDAVRSHILDIHDQLGPTGYVIGNAGRAVIATYLPPPSPPR